MRVMTERARAEAEMRACAQSPSMCAHPVEASCELEQRCSVSSFERLLLYRELHPDPRRGRAASTPLSPISLSSTSRTSLHVWRF